ncbi:hypothetical protein A3H22_00505 [Candidatus Peribacteria bacterium RIFCSPLOWO2_12_FULL_55_15]|nr:MAG: hypothetical protein A3D12_02340 [Candidatus Peribacteria bacterium RIFCSPHIGHO2_02_FULL_55_24]OGJ67427.1 MAG: hypothetical protein A2947_01560 [Candidatus Peribacteria bacterium RIFCSPLOWO2_01_FULL_54_110]OGJ69706.1 MAG: hypothetical protein A3H90_01400 [Candidatus Peribacteria bacterium RIFCSPLOWO2_02_FULL_55_36]OGJ70370.1 MAG: hypothetical protein A3H22_00505 [Candidatus Peribacteria bacterium RIFCSPLOWO2_12_FULL_55_15]
MGAQEHPRRRSLLAGARNRERALRIVRGIVALLWRLHRKSPFLVSVVEIGEKDYILRRLAMSSMAFSGGIRRELLCGCGRM